MRVLGSLLSPFVLFEQRIRYPCDTASYSRKPRILNPKLVCVGTFKAHPVPALSCRDTSELSMLARVGRVKNELEAEAAAQGAGEGSRDMDRKPSDAQKENECLFHERAFVTETKLDSFS